MNLNPPWIGVSCSPEKAAKATKEMIEHSIVTVAEGGQIVNKVAESLDKTSSIAGNVSVRMKEVVDVVEGQTAAIFQVTEGINQISAELKVGRRYARNKKNTERIMMHYELS